VHEEIVYLEQVTWSKTHEYQTYKKPSPHYKKKISFMLSSGMLFVVSSALSTCTFRWTSTLTDYNYCRTQRTSFETKQYWPGMLWQDDVSAPEELAGRPRRAGRIAQAKSTMAKLGAPKAVGLPKPPQTLAKVRELVYECLHCLLACRMSEEHSYIVTSPMWFRVMFGLALIVVMRFYECRWNGAGGN
jgi:hypothetical protein